MFACLGIFIMSEFVGLIVLGGSALLFAIVLPWFHRHQHAHFMETFLVAELASVLFVCVWAIGMALVAIQVFAAWMSHDMGQIVVTVGGVIVCLAVVFLLGRTLVRAQAKRSSGGSHRGSSLAA